jgi:hypothetical protein
VLVCGPAEVRIAELFNHPHSFIGPQFARGLVNVNTPQELKAEAELMESKRRPKQGRALSNGEIIGADDKF